MPEPYSNRFGRRPGRGMRPWLLIPKVLAVGLAFGSLAAMAIPGSGGGDPASDSLVRGDFFKHMARIFLRLSLPALTASSLLGMALLLQHPRIFLRMRWMQLKLISLAILIPSAHAYCAPRLALLRGGMAPGESSATPDELRWGLALACAGLALIIVLGRLKPRLGQNWARAYPAPRG